MKKKKINQSIPQFKTEDEERAFWDTHSVLDFPDVFKPVKLDLSRLKPSTQPITIRLPISLVDDLKMLANKHDVPYQSLMKILLARQVQEERKRAAM